MAALSDEELQYLMQVNNKQLRSWWEILSNRDGLWNGPNSSEFQEYFEPVPLHLFADENRPSETTRLEFPADSIIIEENQSSERSYHNFLLDAVTDETQATEYIGQLELPSNTVTEENQNSERSYHNFLLDAVTDETQASEYIGQLELPSNTVTEENQNSEGSYHNFLLDAVTDENQASEYIGQLELPSNTGTEVNPASETKRQETTSARKRRPQPTSSCLIYSHEPKSRKRRVASLNLPHLIDNNVLFLGQKVQYLNRKANCALAEGWVEREGIKCVCCGNVYSISKFETHVGSSNHHPSANICLEDGRSLMECQLQLQQNNEQNMTEVSNSEVPVMMEGGNEVTNFTGYCSMPTESSKPLGADQVCSFTGYLGDKTQSTVPSSSKVPKSNETCHICQQNGSELLVCGGECMRRFHLNCIGLKVAPENTWFCSSCGCGLCGGGEFLGDGEQFLEKTILYCDQCERGYHVGCLRERGDKGLDSCPQGNWFCGEKCSKIFFRLQKLIGTSNPTGVDGLSWTILKSKKKDGHVHNTIYPETLMRRRLLDARNLLRESFKRIVQPLTKTDLITDIVFSKESTIPYQNYGGFHTMIMHKGGKPISVATFRVHGNKMAEAPLVGTRLNARRRGMCRLLLINLVKLLSDLGVEKMLLSTPQKLLQTWINSLGFAEMSNADRFELSGYAFLEFSDTIVCQKLLKASTGGAYAH